MRRRKLVLDLVEHIDNNLISVRQGLKQNANPEVIQGLLENIRIRVEQIREHVHAENEG